MLFSGLTMLTVKMCKCIINDGKLGGTPVTVDAMGKVTTAIDGYTTPVDIDNNNVADYLEIGTAPTLTANADDQTVAEIESKSQQLSI